MSDIDTLFKRRRTIIKRLISFGFSPKGKGYSYSTSLVDGQFEMTVLISKDEKISADVVDCSSGERYVLHQVSGAKGAFVGQVKQEYKNLLAKIAEACFEPNVFKSHEAGLIIQYIRKKYQNELEFLWPRTPDNAIVRWHDNAKWYAALLTVKREKIRLTGEDAIEIIDLRMKPEDIEALEDGKRYFPGYHMNKKHWVTICLDGSVSLEEIFQRIDESFVLAAK